MPVPQIGAAAVAPPAPAPAAAPRRGFAVALQAARQGGTPPGALPGASAAASPPRLALAALEQAQRRLDAVLAEARRGRTFTARELLSLQAEAYRCAQTLDLASRAVEQVAQSVKQTVNTQV